jgi:hypothetical protein
MLMYSSLLFHIYKFLTQNVSLFFTLRSNSNLSQISSWIYVCIRATLSHTGTAQGPSLHLQKEQTDCAAIGPTRHIAVQWLFL